MYKYFTQTIIGSDNCATTTWIDPVVTGLACVACFMNYTRLSLHRSTSNSASGLMQNKQGLLEWLLSVGINSERPEVRKWSWLTMGSSWRAPHCKYFMSKVKGCVERALKGDKCPKVRGAVACSLGTFVLGLDVNEEGCEFVETFIKYLESGLVAECSKEVRREMLIALQHCYKSLPRGEGEERDLEGGSLGQLSATHGTPSDPFPPNNQIWSSKEPIYSTLCSDETNELLELQKQDYYKFMRRPPRTPFPSNYMPPESTMRPMERAPLYIAESFPEFDETDWIDYSDLDDSEDESFEGGTVVKREESVGDDMLYTNMPMTGTEHKNVKYAMMIDKHRYLVHHEDSMVVYNGQMIEHAWNIPKDTTYAKMVWKDEKLYALNTATGVVEVWSARGATVHW